MKQYVLPVCLLFISICTFSQSRQTIPLNDNWEFCFAYDVRRDAPKTPVTLPHTFNAGDALTDTLHYYRGAAFYTRPLSIPASYRGKRLFLRFEGVNSTAQVLINQQTIGGHQGGYTAFCLEITNAVNYGADNQLTVLVSNAYSPQVLPLSGDFNVYGGIHRPVSLLITSPDCISPLDYASPGVYLTRRQVSKQQANIEIRTVLSRRKADSGLSVRTTILDAADKAVATQTTPVASGDSSVRQTVTIASPHLWNGKADPYLYRTVVELLANNQPVDQVTQPLGLRYFRVDPEKGFFLNGNYLDLKGVCRHQDVQGKGSALTPEDHRQDVALIEQIGATALRLTHYPHSEYFYQLCDQAGLIVWTEIPLVGPGGYTGPGYLANEDLHKQGRQVMRELIRQNYNHPSICFWGLFNELKMDYDNPVPYLQTLQQLVKQEYSTRLTTSATFLDEKALNGVSELIAWNKYFGWYGGKPEEMGAWADNTHGQYPNRGIAVSEYGAGGSVKQHEDSLQAPNPGGRWHPEGWQAYYHEGNWQELAKRPFIWGKFIWVLADFGSSIRSEGDTAGINDKGLITYDRKVKKDAFYFYKANWNPEPMLYLADRRHVQRQAAVTPVKVYTNLQAVELLVNGKSVGRKRPSENRIARWENVTLQKGSNRIEVKGKRGKIALQDHCQWIVE